MQFKTIVVSGAFVLSTMHLQAQGLRESIHTAEKAVPVINQTLSGMWLSELRRPVATGLQAPIPTFVTFFSDGTSLGSPADGTQTATQAIWIRVGDRKFLGTGFFFNFDANRVLTTVTKLRINYSLSLDGTKLTGTTEAVVMDPEGKVLNTFPGATFSMVRLSPEIPADFYDFQKLP
jgi:hypothetical protein